MAKFSKFEVAKFLDSEKVIAEYLKLVTERGDAKEIAEALGEVAKARGMRKTAKATGRSRSTLYHALSKDGNPTYQLLADVANDLGFRFDLVPIRRRRTTERRLAA